MKAQVNGLTIAYRELGAGDPVVLLHALASTSATWDHVAKALADAGRRVIAPDLRGHGGSSRAGAYGLDEFGADVIGLLDHLELSEVDLVGHALGARVATLVSVEDPDRVGRLVLEDMPTPPRLVTPQVRRRTSIAGTVRLLGKLRTFDRAATEPVVQQFRRPDQQWWRGLHSITAKTLLIHGGPLSHLPAGGLVEMTEIMADCRLVTIEAGHQIHDTRPAEYLAEVLPFLLRQG